MGERKGTGGRAFTRRGRTWLALGACCALGLATAAIAVGESPIGFTTLQKRIVADTAPGFRQLSLDDTAAPGDEYVVRGHAGGTAAQMDREDRRTSMAYFGQLSDFQLADEESPARVEFFDPGGDPFGSAHRPWEAMEVHVDEAMIDQMNDFSDDAPVDDGEGDSPEMDFSINTGDSADSQQKNETEWVRDLIEGTGAGTLDPNSGIDPTGYSHPLCDGQTFPADPDIEATNYTGFQDYDDYDETQITLASGANAGDPYFYDPDVPSGQHAGWPTYTGLMDRAEVPFPADGLDAPSYLAFGNHDALLQGSLGGNAVFEEVATGCIKPLTGSFPNGHNILFGNVTVQDLINLRQNQPQKTMLVPPDPDRRFVSKAQYKDIFQSGTQTDGHGFDFIDPEQEAASNDNAGYYSFHPDGVDGVKMIALDTVSEGGALDSAEGNLDDPQYRWLEAELQEARDAGDVVVLFSHHAPDSMNAATSDEAAGPCTGPDAHGHDATISCDIDPRVSTPIHLKADMVGLLHRYPNVIAWVAGHSHTNRVQSFVPAGGGPGFWVLRVAAEADWPQQARLLQLFDNEDGTLSIFGTIIDHIADATAPAGPDASVFDAGALASVARTLAYNDPQSGAAKCSPNPCGEGAAMDRNVELLLDDPRLLPAAPPAPTISSSDPASPADQLAPRLRGVAEANSTVRLYESATCAGPVEASDTAAAFATPGLAASVADGAAVQFTATATDAFGNVSACSPAFAYQEVPSPAPVVKPKKKCKKPKKSKKGKGKKKRKKCR